MNGTATLVATSIVSSKLLASLTVYSGLKAPSGLPRIDLLTEEDANDNLKLMAEGSFTAACETMMVTVTRRVDLIEKSLQLRHGVFIEELGRDCPDGESDEYDTCDAIYVVAVMNGDDVVGTLRCYRHHGEPQSVICIGRVAVRKDLRGKRIGSELMDAAHRHLKVLDIAMCYLNAEVTVAGFYEKLGYSKVGDSFQEAGEAHIRMELKLANLVQCPGCALLLPEDQSYEQVAHMDKFHPEIIAKRNGRYIEDTE